MKNKYLLKAPPDFFQACDVRFSDFKMEYAINSHLWALAKIIYDQSYPKKKTENPVPKTLHFIWLGGEIPEHYVTNINDWSKKNSNFTVEIWPDDDAENPFQSEDYGHQRGVLLGTNGLPNEDTILEPDPLRMAHITDGLSNTMCVTECTGRGVDVDSGIVNELNGTWASGTNISHISGGVNKYDPPGVWYKERIFSQHASGAHGLMCDGSVHFLSESTDAAVILFLCSRDGSEIYETSPFK